MFTHVMLRVHRTGLSISENSDKVVRRLRQESHQHLYDERYPAQISIEQLFSTELRWTTIVNQIKPVTHGDMSYEIMSEALNKSERGREIEIIVQPSAEITVSQHNVQDRTVNQSPLIYCPNLCFACLDSEIHTPQSRITETDVQFKHKYIEKLVKVSQRKSCLEMKASSYGLTRDPSSLLITFWMMKVDHLRSRKKN